MEFRGLHDDEDDNQEEKYFEFGAHFRYKDLVEALKYLQDSQISKNEKEKDNCININSNSNYNEVYNQINKQLCQKMTDIIPPNKFIQSRNIKPLIQSLSQKLTDIDTNKIITEYSSSNNSSQIKKEINQIFTKIYKSQSKKFNERNKITSKDSIYYYIIEEPNLIFIILVDEDYSEDYVFELIEKIQKDEITKMINEETNELNSSGRVELKKIIDIYQKKDENDDDNIENKNIKTNDNKIKINIEKEKNKDRDNNISENIEDLQTKNEEFLLINDKRKWNIKDLKIWKNYRTWLYLAAIVLIILIIEILI